MTLHLRAGATALACLLALPAAAQIPSNVPSTSPLYTPVAPGQYALAPTVSTPLTVPTGAQFAVVCAETATVRYTTDGSTAPTSSVGVPLLSGSCVGLSGAAVLTNFRAFSASGTLDVEFSK